MRAADDQLRALVVDADDATRARSVSALRELGVACTETPCLEAALQLVRPPLDLLIASLGPKRGASTAQLFDSARRCAPFIQCVVTRLPQDQVPNRRYRFLHMVEHPVSPQALEACVRAAGDARRALETLCASLVGRVGLKDAQRVLRASMSELALSKSGGNRYAAAALLDVDRKYVQKLAREVEQRAAGDVGSGRGLGASDR